MMNTTTAATARIAAPAAMYSPDIAPDSSEGMSEDGNGVVFAVSFVMGTVVVIGTSG